jgi:hypothetical protein
MIKMTITIDNDALQRLANRLTHCYDRNEMPHTAEAVKTASRVVMHTWKDYARGGTLPGVEKLKNPKRGYAGSISMVRIGPFDYEIVSNAKIAEWLENGTKPIDMKETHTRGPRSRIAKKKVKGFNAYRLVPYVIVPFRWGTPKTIGFRTIIPESVYAVVSAKKFEKTVTTVDAKVSDIKTLNARGKGEMVGRAQYEWGSKLIPGMAEGMTRDMEGMSNMEGQGGISAGYYTFRVISADSPAESWRLPGMKARHVTQGVVNVTQDLVNDLVDYGIKKDFDL